MSSSRFPSERSLNRRWPLEEKRRIVELTMQNGASVQDVAKKYDLYSSTLSHWRSLYRKGYLNISKKEVSQDDSPMIFFPITSPEPHTSSISSRIVVGINMPSGITVRIEADDFDLSALGSLLASIQ